MQRVLILGIFMLVNSYEALGQSTSSDDSDPETCPELPAEANFNHERFSGRWYEIFTSAGNPRVRCYTTDFSANNRTIRVNDTMELLDGSRRKDVNTMGEFSVEEPAKIKFNISGSSAQNYAEFYVKWFILESDYDNYALIWRCIASNATEDYQETAWIVGRLPVLSQQNITYLNGRLSFYGLENLGYSASRHDKFCTYPTCI